MLKPWYEVAIPREDLRSGEPLDASEFAIDLDEVRGGKAHQDYVDPERFFSRTCFTRLLKGTAIEVLKRLSGETVGTSPIINLTTPFGGGKTHFLTLLYHLAVHGPSSHEWKDVKEFLSEAKLNSVPKAKVAVFVGDRFDPLVGREGRLTPWGEIAWQLGGYETYRKIEQHDKGRVTPSIEKIEEILPPDEPVLILMDEILKFMSNARAVRAGDSNMATQFYNFLSSLSGAISRRHSASLVTSLPKSTLEMTSEDEADFASLRQLLGRRDLPVILAEGLEIAEIIRHRLFEKIDSEEAHKIAQEYAKWTTNYRDQLAHWFPIEKSQEYFENYYPFHPTTLLVFERKWQGLPYFQKARGILKMLALWISRAYQDALKSRHAEPVINLGSAPLEESNFRATTFEQLGEDRLEAAILSDIVGEAAVATRFDSEAPETVKKAALHQKVAKSIFFESSGGQVKEGATLPEIRLALSEPGLDIGNVETALQDLASPVNGCFHLHVEGPYYRYSHVPNLNKLLIDSRANISPWTVEEKVKEAIRSVFAAGPTTFERCYFPKESSDIPDVTMLTLVVMPPDQLWEIGIREKTKEKIENFVNEYGSRARIFKNALFFVVPHSRRDLDVKARDFLAAEVLEGEADLRRLSKKQKGELKDIKAQAQEDLKSKVWQVYRYLIFLDKEGLSEIDLGLLFPDSARALSNIIERRLKQDGILAEIIAPSYLIRNWGGFPEWSTEKLKKDFYATPKLTRITNYQNLKKTIANGVKNGELGYAIKSNGEYKEIHINEPSFSEEEVEFCEQAVLLKKEEVLKAKEDLEKSKEGKETEEEKEEVSREERERRSKEIVIPSTTEIAGIEWEGEISRKQLMNFSTKVLSYFASEAELTLNIRFEAFPPEGINREKIKEIREALMGLGLDGTKVQERKERGIKRSWDKEF